MSAAFLLVVAPPVEADPTVYKTCLSQVEANHSSASLEDMLAAAKAECAQERDAARIFMRAAVATKTKTSVRAPDSMIEQMVDDASVRWLNEAGWSRASQHARKKN